MDCSALRKELNEYYFHHADKRSYAFYEKVLPELDAGYDPSMTPFAMKRFQYRVIAERMEPVIFKTNPFYYETGTLAAHCDGARDFRGHKNVAGWTYWKNAHLFVDQNPELWELTRRQRAERMYLVCGPYNDVSQHFCFNFRPVLAGGLKGIYDRAMAQMEGATENEKDFLLSVCEGMLAIKKIAEKFSAEAERMAQNAQDDEEKARLLRIADSAAHAPWEAPRSFYEALNTLALMRKAVGALEGIGNCSFGRVDMDLYPFYKKDKDAGLLSDEDAYGLVKAFLVTFDAHFDRNIGFSGYAEHELENTYVLGGCHPDGTPLCNELTLMFLRATNEETVIYPKVKLRFSKNSPKELFDEANKSLLRGSSVILYQNDDATIPALLAMGRTIEEARDYLVSGCWDVNVSGIEKSDEGAYVNLLRPLEYSVHRSFEKMVKVGMYFRPIDGAADFEEVYSITKENIRTLLKERARILRLGGNIWDKVDPHPIFSSTLDDCIAKRLDFTQGGAKYRDDRNYGFAFGNLMNSLLVIKELCFEQKKYTLEQVLGAVRNNWEGCEEMRLDATHCHGWGDGSKEASQFCRRLNEDISEMLSHETGAYGGKIVLGHLGYTEVRWWGEETMATPDGRKNGDYLTQGLTPSRLTKIPSITNVANSFAQLDPSVFGGNTVTNMMLPSAKMNPAICEAFLRAVADSAVMSLQLNCVSKEELLDAQIHPEKYPELIVRVTGFSAKFTSLSREWQNEILTRNFYEN